jgi:hypothetical protein
MRMTGSLQADRDFAHVRRRAPTSIPETYRVIEASSDWRVAAKPARREHVPLGILYMIGATVVFAGSSAASKWLVEKYPVGEVLFTRTAVALITCAAIILPHAGLAVFRTTRLRHHAMRRPRWRAKRAASAAT